mgnify:CR=1 FL=1|jgi:hypothetical protein
MIQSNQIHQKLRKPEVPSSNRSPWKFSRVFESLGGATLFFQIIF